jgi:Cu(I)/Ag(I) efflux system membrane fusion protein
MNVAQKKGPLILALIVVLIVSGSAFYFFDRARERTENSAPRATVDAALTRFRSGSVEISIATEPAIPRVGENRLILELRDENGDPLSVPVEAVAMMPAMGQMPEMRAPAGLSETAPGLFEGSMNLSMRGEWPLTVTIQDPQSGVERRLQFDYATDRPGLTIAAGGEPLARESGSSDAPSAGETLAIDDSTVITIDNRRRQLIGVELGDAAVRNLVRPIRAVGEVVFDERLLSQVTLRFDGFIGELDADYVGIPISAGQRLFTVYSPELLAAQQDYLDTLRRRGDGADNALLSAARQRLRLWDVPDAEINALERRGAPADYLPILAPRAGTLVERNITEGGAARMGQTLLAIADLSRLWIEARVFEADLELLDVGMPAIVSLPYLPGLRFETTIDYVYPYLEGNSRAGRVRLTLDNPDGVLKPEMYAEVSLQVPLGEQLSVPEEAVIVAGASRIVFVDLGGGRLRPVRIETGRRAQGFVEVLSGLAAGDRVVTSGNFLIAAETRLKTGIDQW